MKLYKYPIFQLNLSFNWRFLTPLRSIRNDNSSWRFLTPLRSIRNDNSIVMMREAETILVRELSLLPISRLNKAYHSERQRRNQADEFTEGNLTQYYY
jgi:hypothetical protein